MLAASDLPAEARLPAWPALLRALREAAGVTQDGWAARLGMGRRTVQRWERGLIAPDAAGEAALLAACAERGLFRAYRTGTLAGLALTPQLVQHVLAEARGDAQADSPRTSGAPAASTATATEPSAGLPIPLTSFVGREHELLRIGQLLETRRLVTLTGPGGVGKTRLAITAAEAVWRRFPDGVCFVDVSDCTDAEQTLTAIVRSLAMRVEAGQPPATVLTRYLRPRQTLLVLDNFEQAISGAPAIVALLAAAPALQVLVTSRVPLRVAGEQEFPVTPLALPAAGGAPDLTSLRENAAVALFTARAGDVRPDFALDAGNAPAVAAICRRLDGLPLAIELAAVRLRVLAPAALLARLATPLPLLAGGGRDRPARQQTLEATIAWSYALLNAAEQRLLRRLAVFVGGWTLEAAEAVCAGGDTDAGAVLDGLNALAENSLVQQEETAEGERRFSLLSTVREFALARLAESGELPWLQAQHAACFGRLAEEAESHLQRPQPWMGRLRVEQDNLRAALQWAVDIGAAEPGMRIVGNLWGWYYRTGPGEGRRWAETLLGLPSATGRTRTRASALYTAGLLAWTQADAFTAERHVCESVAMCRDLGEERLLALALCYQGVALAIQGEIARGRAAGEEAVAIARARGDWWDLTNVLMMLGQVEAIAGEFAAARRRYEETAALVRANDPRREMPIRGAALAGLSTVAFLQGDVADAEAACEEALLTMHSAESVRNFALPLANLGHITARRGDAQQARSLFAESLMLAHEHSFLFIVASALGGLAGLLLQTQPQRAARLCGAADAIFAATHASHWPMELIGYADLRDAARAALGADSFSAAYTAGQALTEEQAIAEALDAGEPSMRC